MDERRWWPRATVRAEGVIFGQWNRRKFREENGEAFEWNLEDRAGSVPVEVDGEEGVSDRPLHIKTTVKTRLSLKRLFQ